VALSGIAGQLRERRTAANGAAQVQADKAQGTYLIGLTIAVLAGVLSAMLNLSLAFGEPIASAALRSGAAASEAAFAVWPIALAGGLLPNFGYAVWLLARNHSWKTMTMGWRDASLSVLMGLLWFSAVAIYGISTRYLGRLGDSAGWAIYEITIVLTANVAGLVAGEWKRASRTSVTVLAAGVLILVVATTITAASTR
jgi:L-rhamnose-H+ transport protein